MNGARGANLALRFLLEIGAVVAVADWGFKVGNGSGTKLVLGIGAPVVFIAVWAVFVAPKSVVTVPTPVKAGLGIVVLELAALALAFADGVTLGVVFGVVVVANAVLLLTWGQ